MVALVKRRAKQNPGGFVLIEADESDALVRGSTEAHRNIRRYSEDA